MAKFDSIVFGKSSGSIGNVTTARLKGQNIAKAKITQTTNVNSVGQVESRGKMSNIVLAWQFLSVFLVYISALRKPVESNYNAFVRGFKTLVSDVVVASRSAAAALLNGLDGLAGNFVTISSVAGAGASVTIALVTGGLPFSATTYVRVISYISATGESQIVNRLITEAEWLAGAIIVTGNLATATDCGAYLYDSLNKKCSNVFFGEY